ncbi:MAG: DNA-3-methyladenine glycosylase [Clostridia bacterium]|jgi:DNA-3-methyladenine glycosylase|nr:DNA-3-methyladenine glycosylase [Clostridia bacterium]
MNPLTQAFYLREAVTVAKELLGKILIRQINGRDYCFKIVETEAYMGAMDKASHAYGGKFTNRTKPMFERGGITYIYLIYGMYYCLNIVTQDKGIPHAVLIRAVEPLDEGAMKFAKSNRLIKSKKNEDLTNGPGKLCQALVIDKTLNEKDITKENLLWIADAPSIMHIIKDKRINIPYAMEYQDMEWRFYIADNPFVSVLKNN